MYRLLLLLLIAPTVLASETSLRVMTFNMLCGWCAPIRYGTWGEREAGFTDTLQRARPDLLAVQELMTAGQLETVTQALPDLRPYFRTRTLNYYDSIVLFNRTRFELLRSGDFWLSAEPDAGIGWGWVTSVPRMTVWVKLRDKNSGAEFYFVGAHMDNNRVNKRPSAELIRRRLAAFGEAPVILAGDFNSKPGSESLAILMGKDAGDREFFNSFDLAEQREAVGNAQPGWAFGCTDHKPKDFPGCRIDHVLLSNGVDWRVGRYSIDFSRYGWRENFISDHRAVWADIMMSVPDPTALALRAPHRRLAARLTKKAITADNSPFLTLLACATQSAGCRRAVPAAATDALNLTGPNS